MSAIPKDHDCADAGDSDRSSTYILVIVIEVIVIAGLYWLGRYFG